jgi:hypothetical protein
MNKKNLLILVVAAVVVFFGFAIWQSITFRLVDSIPGNNSHPNQYTLVAFKFNKSLSSSDASANQISIVPDVPGRSSIDGKEVIFIPVSSYQTRVEYTATLSNILGANGEKLADITIKFTPQYVTYSDLPNDVKARLVNQTDVNDTKPVPYSAASIAISGSDDFLNHGVSTEQLDGLKSAFYKFFKSKGIEIRGVNLSDLTKTPHDRYSSSTVDTITFTVALDNGTKYKGKIEYSNITTVRLLLYASESGAQVYDSGNIGN